MALPLSRHHIALGVANSDLTGVPWLVADFRSLSVSIQSQTNAASRFTLIGSNDDGLRSPLGTPLQTGPSEGWSTITGITGQGLYNFDPGALGFRWINVFRPSASSATVTFQGRT